MIVDAFGSPTIRFDLAAFDNIFGLPAPPSFTIVCPQGCHSNQTTGWSLETTLDVEWSHAMAPNAHIVLVVSRNSYDNIMAQAELSEIPNYPGSVMSQSWGDKETELFPYPGFLSYIESPYPLAQTYHVTAIASAGDWGATSCYPAAGGVWAKCYQAVPIFPASDPLNLAVGGTMGLPYPTGLVRSTCTPTCIPTGYGAEQVWNENPLNNPIGVVASTGGAPSLIFSTPSYQNGLGLTMRTTPDVSYNAAVGGGVLVYWSAPPETPGLYIVGGTSAGSPQWAGIIALANQYAASKGLPALGFINAAIYTIAENPTMYAADFHDITVGNNIQYGTTIGFYAATGYDDASGWGTPNVANLIPNLVSP
jgi:subtilase family serine protease